MEKILPRKVIKKQKACKKKNNKVNNEKRNKMCKEMFNKIVRIKNYQL